jgi:transglutaminase-like putative cysteine protease
MARPDAGAAISVERFFQFSLLGLAVAGYLAVAAAGTLDRPTVLLTGIGLLLRALVICGLLRVEFSERSVTLATLGYTGFYALDYLLISHSLLTATVHMAFFLAVLKILTARTTRDYYYTALIAFMELVAAAVLSIDLTFFVFLALFLLFAIAALTSGEIRRSLHRSATVSRSGLRRFHPRLGTLSFLVAAGILALTAGLFFLLPRTADAAFSRLTSNPFYLPGFSNRVSLGDVGEIKTSSRPIMHIRIFHTERLPGLKWRGGVLTTFDGKTWTNSDTDDQVLTDRGHLSLLPPSERRVGTHISYDVEFDSIDTDALFFAGVPEGIDLSARTLLRDRSGVVRLGHTPPPGFRYEAYSLLEDPPETDPVRLPPPLLDESRRERDLQLPASLDPRIAALARTFTEGRTSDLGRARAIERHLHADYGYTLTLPSRELADPLAYFLFTRKKGHCEYFASAMAVMLRTLGIPARLAIGFQSGIYNTITDLWLIRASDAHTWVEAWIPGRGWTTFDPTPPDPNASAYGVFAKFGLYLDAAATFWHEWVVDYDVNRQSNLADRVEQHARRLGVDWFDFLSEGESAWSLGPPMWLRRYGIAAGFFVVFCVWIWYVVPRLLQAWRERRRVESVRRGKATVADATLLYSRMLQILRRHGYQKPMWFTPGEFAASLPAGPLQVALAEFTASYNALRFGGRTDVAPLLGSLLDRLERQESR